MSPQYNQPFLQPVSPHYANQTTVHSPQMQINTHHVSVGGTSNNFNRSGGFLSPQHRPTDQNYFSNKQQEINQPAYSVRNEISNAQQQSNHINFNYQGNRQLQYNSQPLLVNERGSSPYPVQSPTNLENHRVLPPGSIQVQEQRYFSSNSQSQQEIRQPPHIQNT